MPSAPMRAFLGFIAAAIAVLTFHQGMVGGCMHRARLGSVPAISDHTRAAVRCAAHCQQLLLRRALGRSVRIAHATLHLADVALRFAPRLTPR